MESIRKKLKTGHKKTKHLDKNEPKKAPIIDDDDKELEEYYLNKDRDIEKQKKMYLKLIYLKILL